MEKTHGQSGEKNFEEYLLSAAPEKKTVRVLISTESVRGISRRTPAEKRYQLMRTMRSRSLSLQLTLPAS